LFADLVEVRLDEGVGRVALHGVVVADVHEAERLAALELVGQGDRPRPLDDLRILDLAHRCEQPVPHVAIVVAFASACIRSNSF